MPQHGTARNDHHVWGSHASIYGSKILRTSCAVAAMSTGLTDRHGQLLAPTHSAHRLVCHHFPTTERYASSYELEGFFSVAFQLENRGEETR